MKLVVFVILLAVSAILAYSESKPTYKIAPSEYSVDSKTPAVSESNEDSDEDDSSDEEKTYNVKPTVASYNALVSNYGRTYDEPKYLATYSTPYAPTVQVAPAAAPAYKAPFPSYDRPALLPYWLRPRTY
ncbi:hypothetical protein DAPPUDRAFT_100222 [Daphnia pulex]|uniref:Uncharacterized protein n=1 Tax=Daphnia pulex TaxID=6669 RepID=E9G9T3_DAPPU|nr:hypothetical protein DAPPUDRAFT_100222 [Daphnia pulex]|eukprot:EFX83828.1 hypothetical protein DAPPUDRAFT_100222 [Daphnia pulex]